MKQAFTLIELLIVVAIIAILAAIAVPNFLEAQTRAKVSRVIGDMHAVTVGIETYRIDWNHYPFDFADDVAYPYYLNKGLTTPVNYVSGAARMEDIFAKNVTDVANRVQHRFRYRAFGETWLSSPHTGIPFSSLPGPNTPGIRRAQDVFGSWFLESKGPDAKTGPLPQGFSDGSGANDWLWQLYDPTNGTLSTGDILRAQKGDINAQGYKYTVSY